MSSAGLPSEGQQAVVEDRGDRHALPPIRPFAVLAASLRRDWGSARSYRFPLALTGVQLFATVASYFFLGRLVGHGSTAAVGSQLKEGYFSFAVIGTALLSFVGISLTTFARRVRTDQTTGTLEVLLISPAPAWLVVPATASYELLFGGVSALATVGLASVIFGLRFDVTPPSLMAAVLGFAGGLVLFCAIGIAFAGFILVVKRGDSAISLLIVAFSLLCGVVYPIELLPTPLRVIGEALPFTWVLQVMRSGLLDSSAQWLRLAELWVTALALVPISLWIFDRALRRARWTGTLAQY